jgi:23S rRNA pseudouridine1911/1915/1917 synthase
VVLSRWLPAILGRELSRSTLRRWIMGGAVLVEGRVVRRPGLPLYRGARIEVRLRKDALTPGVRGDRAVVLGPERILFEDAVLIAVDKPPGLPTQPTVDPRRPNLYGLVKALLDSRGNAGPGQAYLGLHQRLDRDTSGVVVFTKSAAANPGVAAAFADQRVVKTYLALAERPARLPPRQWSVEAPAADGAMARTEFRLREVLAGGLLVEARPITGKKHQIRIHLAGGRMPILGDSTHGGKGSAGRASRLMLHASSLALPHPTSGQPLVIESPLPEDFRAAVRKARSS